MRSGIFRIGGWCLLLLFVLTSTPVGAGMTALLGSFDASHRVCVGSGEQTVQVVLHHQCNGVRHHHGLIARVLTGFALKPGPANPDHVIQFRGSDALSRQARVTPPEGCQAPHLPPAWFERLNVLSSEGFSFFVSNHPPPTDGGLVTCLRSTVLLI